MVGDISGHYGSPSVFGFTIPLVEISSYTFMAGPKIMYHSGVPVTPFAHFLIGAARRSTTLGILLTDHALAAAAGSGVDIRLNNRILVRANQADYVMTEFNTFQDRPLGSNERQNNIRLSAGVVFRFR